MKLNLFPVLVAAGCASLLTVAGNASGGRPAFSVRVPIWLQASDADQPSPLTAGELSAHVRGRKIVPDFLLGPDSDLFLLVALDFTADPAAASDAKEALGAEIRQLPPRVYVSALNCQDELRVLQEPTAARDRVMNSIQSVEVIGKAGLLNCMERVESIADAMLARSAIRVGVIFVTDASVQNYREDLINPVINSSDSNDISRRFPEQLVQDAMTALSRRMAPSLAPLYIVQLNYQTDRWNEAYYDGLRMVAENTMGEAQFCATRAAIPDSVERCFMRLRAHYSARFAVPPQEESVNVDLNTSSSSKSRLHYRSRFTMRTK